jgi:hypothetical protein
MLFFIPTEDNTLQQQATMPRFTRNDKIDVLKYAINIDVPKGQCRRITNINKAPIHIIDKLLQERGVDDAKFNEYYYKIKNQEVVARDMFNHQQKLLAEERKIDEEFRQMEDEDFRSQFCSLPDEIKLICKKKSEYEHYISELKYKKKIIHKFNTEKKTANDTITWDNGRPVIRIKGITYYLTRIFSTDFRGGVYRHTITKEIIEDYKKGLIPVWFKIKIKVKKNRRTKV